MFGHCILYYSIFQLLPSSTPELISAGLSQLSAPLASYFTHVQRPRQVLSLLRKALAMMPPHRGLCRDLSVRLIFMPEVELAES